MARSREHSTFSKPLPVSNCEASVAGKFNITLDDVSEFFEGAPDNDFHCPHTGEYVALERNGGKVNCQSPDCRYLNDT